jgi:peptidoglycan/LPS O-acetylase OafA/YrhL
MRARGTCAFGQIPMLSNPVQLDLHGKRRLNALTSLRFFAAMHVVLFHCAPTLAVKTGAALNLMARHSDGVVRMGAAVLSRSAINLLDVGPWSVSFFFVLSGFILVYNYGDDRRPLNVRRFWIARFARIYPVYLIGFLLAMPFVLNAIWQVHGHAHEAVTGGILAATMLQSWIPRYATFWNIPAWSMSDEAFFYALFPLVLFRMRRLNSTRGLVGTMTVCWAISILKEPAIGFIAHRWAAFSGTAANPMSVANITHYSPLCRLPEFVAGMALGRIMLLRGAPGVRGGRLAMLTLGPAVAILVLAAMGDYRPTWVNSSGALTPLFAMIVWSLSVEDGVVARMLSNRGLVFLGDSSYAIYILHLPLFAIYSELTAHLLPHSATSVNLSLFNYLSPMLFIVVMLCVCGFVYKSIEIPARNRVRQALEGWRKPMRISLPPIKALEAT